MTGERRAWLLNDVFGRGFKLAHCQFQTRSCCFLTHRFGPLGADMVKIRLQAEVDKAKK